MEIVPPREFSFDQCLRFLGRSDLEPLHRIENETLFKIVQIEGRRIPISVTSHGNRLKVVFLSAPPAQQLQDTVRDYIEEWLDFETDLAAFYKLARSDRVLASLVTRFFGLRLIKILNLFQAMTWAVIGQQINIRFAYMLYRRFVEAYGEYFSFGEQKLWVFPAPDAIADLRIEDLAALQFTRRKAEYVIGIAQRIAEGELSRQTLLTNSPAGAREILIGIRGIGNWTANYVMMRCAGFRSAFPIEDIGLHNAIKQELNLPRKPTIDEIRGLSSGWKGWEAYATFYLYRSLL